MEKTIRVLVADDHTVVRTGLISLLKTKPEIEVIDEAVNGVDAIEKALLHRPDVVIMDITMPVMDGFEATRQLRKKSPVCYVLALTVHDDPEYFLQMVAAGARGYIGKHAAGQELAEAIRTVAAGDFYFQKKQLQWLVEEYSRLANRSNAEIIAEDAMSSDDLKILSAREIEVIQLIAEGLTTPEIGERLELSPKTISRHRERIMTKLRVNSSTQLVKFAIRNGLVDVL